MFIARKEGDVHFDTGNGIDYDGLFVGWKMGKERKQEFSERRVL